MSDEIDSSEIDALLNGIISGNGDTEADSGLTLPSISLNSRHERMYDFMRQDIVSTFQLKKIEKYFSDITSDISNYFSKLLEQPIHCNFLCTEQESIDSFQRCIPTPSYLYSFEIDGSFGFFEIDPTFFNTVFLKRKTEQEEHRHLGKLERNICWNYAARPILEKAKPFFAMHCNKCEYTKITNTEQCVKNGGERSLIITLELKSQNCGNAGNINFDIPKELLTKIKSDGFLKSNTISSPKENNTKVVLGGFYIEDESQLEVGKTYELDKICGENLDIIFNGKKVAEAEPVLFDNIFSVKINKVISPNQKKDLEIPCPSPSVVPSNANAVLGRFTLNSSEILKAQQVINLDRESSDYIDVEKDGRIIAKAEIIADPNFFGVKIISKM